MAKKSEAPTERVLVMGVKGGKLRRVTIPSDWKITFGSVTAGARAGGGNYDGSNGWCLRLYAKANDQRAVFTDVTWFRDEMLPVQERVTKTTRRTIDHDTPGLKKGSVVEASVKEWVDVGADDPMPETAPRTRHAVAFEKLTAQIDEGDDD